MPLKNHNVLLFGSAYMANEYLKVLSSKNCRIQVVGRDRKKAEDLANRYGAVGIGGGTANLKRIDPKSIDLTIIATSVDSLKEITIECLESGMKNILVEKPGAVNLTELEKIKSSNTHGAKISIAYNRRFYNSVIKLKQKIVDDGGSVGCFFDFTDREKDIMSSKDTKAVVEHWGLANSTHVIDTAFHLIGLPENIFSLRDSSWEKHPSGNAFAGCGRTASCLFSYYATWAGGGRWNIEVSTKEGRYKLSPLEELVFIKKNKFVSEKIENDDDDDLRFKPGLYKMVGSMLTDVDSANLPSLDEQIELVKTANRIFGYED